jgi:uncharacterized Zn finger protein (UPF0148 family)
MHSATCPVCGKRVEVDFEPIAGQVWCPDCQKSFSPAAPSEPDRQTESIKKPDRRNGEAD